jgi:hypothetical protein
MKANLKCSLLIKLSRYLTIIASIFTRFRSVLSSYQGRIKAVPELG